MHSWWMCCCYIIVCFNASAVTQHLFIIHAKWGRQWCSASEFYLSLTRHLSPPLPPLLISVPCTLFSLPVSLHLPLLINCACISHPKTDSCSLRHVSLSLFLFCPPSSPIFLHVGEGHGRHHPQWFTAVPVLPSGLQSADTAPDAESDSTPQGQRRAGLHRYTHIHTVRQSQ